MISLAVIAGFVHSPMVIANSWFIRQRARAMTVVSAAVPVGGAILSPLLAVGVQSLGWRWAAFLSGSVSGGLRAFKFSSTAIAGEHGAFAGQRSATSAR